MSMREEMRKAMEACNQRVFYDIEVDAALDVLINPTPEVLAAFEECAFEDQPESSASTRAWTLQGIGAMVEAIRNGK